MSHDAWGFRGRRSRRLLARLAPALPPLVALGALTTPMAGWALPLGASTALALGVVGLAGLVAAGAAVLAWWGARRRLGRAALARSGAPVRPGPGGFGSLPPRGAGEPQYLAYAFAHMAESLRHRGARRLGTDETFRRVFDTLPLPAALYRGDLSAIVEANAAFCHYYGRTRAQLVGRLLADHRLGLPAEARGGFAALLREYGCVRNFEVPVQTPWGGLRRVLSSAELLDIAGSHYVLCVQLDITDRTRVEAALCEREQQLALIVQSAQDGIISVNAAGAIVVFNDAASRMFGVPAQQALSCTPLDVLPKELACHLLVGLCPSACAHASGARRQRVSALHRDGGALSLEVVVFCAGEGERRTLTALVRDLSEQEMAEAALVESSRATAANQAKTQFLARMSHELRTPLNALLGFARLLDEGARAQWSATQAQQMDMLTAAGQQLRALIDDVLDLARIEAGGLAVASQLVGVDSALDEAASLLAEEAVRYGVTLVPRAPGHVAGLHVRADRLRVQQVLLNVVSNAVKYNRCGGTVRLLAQPRGGQVALTVEDDGAGMSAAQVDQAFEPFNRLGRERGAIPGTGIGLSLCRQMMELMQGDVAITSVESCGTCVVLTFPLGVDTPALAPDETGAAAAAVASPAGEPRGTVLYVEDVALNAAVVRGLLAPWTQVHLVVAEDGASGVQLARELHPSLVLLDMHLPDATGLDVLARLRSANETASLPVVCLSADALPEGRAAALDAGADAYWTKPVDFDQFRREVPRWLRCQSDRRRA